MAQKKKELFREGEMHLEHGTEYLRRGYLPAAHRALNVSIWNNSHDINTLLTRAKLFTKYRQYDKALKDLESTLDINPHELRALQERASIQYLNGDFEYGLISNSRGAPIRQQPPAFQEGILHCREAIETAIGPQTGHPLRDYYNIIKKLEEKRRLEREIAEATRWKRKISPKSLREKYYKIKKRVPQTVVSTKNIKTVGPLPDPTQEKKIRPILPTLEQYARVIPSAFQVTRPTMNQMDVTLKPESKTVLKFKPTQSKMSNIKKVAAERYLERMTFDKDLLAKCAENATIRNPNEKGCKRIKREAIRGYNTLTVCEESLRARRPLFSLKYQEMESTKSLQVRETQGYQILQSMAKLEADNLIALLRNARESYNFRLCQDICERSKIFFDNKNKKVLPRKDEYLEIMYNIIGLVYLDALRITPNTEIPEARVKFMLGIPLSRSHSEDSLIESMKPAFIDTRKSITTTENRIRGARSALELAWLYHDLARYWIEIKNYYFGRHYGLRCVEQADAIGNEVWAINGSFLVVKCCVALRNRNDAKDELLDTISRAKKIYYPHGPELILFLEQTMQVIEELDFEEIAGDAILERQHAIVQLASTKDLKANFQRLFEKMAIIPTKRRMSIVPGFNFERDDKSDKLSKNHNKISITHVRKIREIQKPSTAQKTVKGDKFIDWI